MKLDFNRKYTTIAVYAFLVIAAGLLFQNIVNDFPPLTRYFNKIGDLLLPFVVGGALAYILNPILNWIELKLFPVIFRDKISRKARRALSVLLSYLFMLLVIGVFALIVVPQIYESIMSLIERSSTYVKNVEDFLNYLIATYGSNELVKQVLQKIYDSAETIFRQGYQLIGDVVPMIANIAIGLTNSLFDTIMGLIISVYSLLMKETFAAQIKKLLSAFCSRNFVETFLSIAHDSNQIFCGFISGKIVDSFIIGVICFVGTTLMNTPYAMLVSVIIGVTNVIPYFGPFIGAIPSILLILLVNPLQALYFSIFILALQQLDGNVIGPKILGDSTGLSAFWVVFSVTFFGGMFGFVGMLIGVPTFAVIYNLISRFAAYCLHKKGMPTNTEAYASPERPLVDKPKSKHQKG
ncbi:MAG: AI-2E family transporter [Ruminococcaceae bacterium]|nr:AI-2E family transporter [Oscillospiraceae bacterium]